jgi:hypothetical protein
MIKPSVFLLIRMLSGAMGQNARIRWPGCADQRTGFSRKQYGLSGVPDIVPSFRENQYG